MGDNFILHENDLPEGLVFGDTLAIDTEFMGLNVNRDRLCLVQIYDGLPASAIHLVRFKKDAYAAPNLKKLLSDPKRRKLCFFARADMRWIGRYLGVIMENIFCLKLASRIARTYTRAHNLEDVCREVLGLRLSKEQQTTDWGGAELTPEQLRYAAYDVLHLHALDEKLRTMLAREGRLEIVEGLSACLPAVVRADLAGWPDEDIFAHDVP